MIFVDTNYFLRYLRADIPKQYEEAKDLFLKAAIGEVTLFTSITVIFEIYWVMQKFYGENKEKTAGHLKDILSMGFVKVQEGGVMKQAIDIYSRTKLDLEDSYNLVYAINKKAEDFKTFDKKLEKAFKVQ